MSDELLFKIIELNHRYDNIQDLFDKLPTKPENLDYAKARMLNLFEITGGVAYINVIYECKEMSMNEFMKKYDGVIKNALDINIDDFEVSYDLGIEHTLTIPSICGCYENSENWDDSLWDSFEYCPSCGKEIEKIWYRKIGLQGHSIDMISLFKDSEDYKKHEDNLDELDIEYNSYTERKNILVLKLTKKDK